MEIWFVRDKMSLFSHFNKTTKKYNILVVLCLFTSHILRLFFCFFNFPVLDPYSPFNMLILCNNILHNVLLYFIRQVTTVAHQLSAFNKLIICQV